MFGTSYSREALILTSAKLIEVNNSWEYPDYVPSPNEIMPGGLRDLIGGKRKLKKSLAKKRSSFDSGVAYAINKHFFDGKDKHFKEFLSKSLKEAFGPKIGKMVFKNTSFAAKQPEMFAKGVEWVTSELLS